MSEKNSTIVTGNFKKSLFRKKFAGRKLMIGLLSFIILGVLIGGVVYMKNRPKPVPVVNCQEHIDKLAAENGRNSYVSAVGLADLYLQKNCPPNQKVILIEQKAIALLFQNKLDEAELLFKQVETINGGKLDVIAAQSLATISYSKGDTTTAIKYYKALIQATLDTPNELDDAWIPQYKTIIKNLGGTP